MTRRRPLLLLAALLLAAASPAERLPPLGEGRVAAVIDGDTLELADGRRVRLAGIEAAKPPPGREAERRWPLAEAATAALTGLAAGRPVRLHGPDGTLPDRHGRLPAHAVGADGRWWQGELLAAGHARVRTLADGRELAAEMLALEAAARDRGLGLWRTRAYAVRPADPQRLRRDVDSFQIVEGRVLRAEKRGGTVYLDFGEDWRSDVTARIDRDALRAFARDRFDPLALQAETIRVRGWIGDHYGPTIEVTHPEQIERLGRRPPAPEPSAHADTEEE